MVPKDIATYHLQLFKFYLSVLDLRTLCAGHPFAALDATEEVIITAFTHLVLRLAETAFKPMFLKLLEWGTRAEAATVRQLVLYRVVDALAGSLKSLFVPYFSNLLKTSIAILDGTAAVVQDATLGGVVRPLVVSVLHKCFLFDDQVCV